tara:strand:- start:9414 stop:10337 length:924 start_codon:yes stop_codon:yes gene_type:complete
MDKINLKKVNFENKSPFDLENESGYQEWRQAKLDNLPDFKEIKIESESRISKAEITAMRNQCNLFNFSVFKYACPPADPESALRLLGESFGLKDIDANLCSEDSGISEITVKKEIDGGSYIPYTNKQIGWHCDGYYNPPGQEIRAMLLYCHQPAVSGGENSFLDHEIAYIRIRDKNPDWIRALTAPDAFTIPANIEGNRIIRPEVTGPVFKPTSDGLNLHMRYSARKKNVRWASNSATKSAANFLLQLFDSDESHILNLKMERGQGILSNNILHKRTSFLDTNKKNQKRVIYRARYHNKVASQKMEP